MDIITYTAEDLAPVAAEFAAEARALVTDPQRAAITPAEELCVAWLILLVHRRQRMAAARAAGAAA